MSCVVGCGRTELSGSREPPSALWSFGDDRTTVLRGTVQDSDGFLYVPTYISDQPVTDLGDLGPGKFAVSKLTTDGNLLWQTELENPQFPVLPPSWRGAIPLVAAENVMAYFGGHSLTLDRATGGVVADTNVQGLWPASAVGFDGWMYGTTQLDTTPVLYGFSPDTQEPPDFITDLDVPFVENGDAPGTYGLPAIAEDRLVAACRSDICGGSGQGPREYGLAAFDLHTGAVQWLAPVDATRFGDVALDASGRAYSLVSGPQRLVRTDAHGVSVDAIDLGAFRTWSRPVIGEAGPMVVGQDIGSSLPPALKLGREDLVPLDVPWFGGWYVVLARPNTIILHARDVPDLPADISQWPHHGLAGLSTDGSLLWEYDGASFDPHDIPIPGNGRVFARTADARLLAVQAPIDGVDRGPWPMPYGDTGRTRREAR